MFLQWLVPNNTSPIKLARGLVGPLIRSYFSCKLESQSSLFTLYIFMQINLITTPLGVSNSDNLPCNMIILISKLYSVGIELRKGSYQVAYFWYYFYLLYYCLTIAKQK